MKNITKKIILILFVIIILKIILSSFVLSPSAFSDEYTYAKMARSFFNSGDFSIHEIPTRQYLPLYPIIISISYVVQDMQLVYLIIKIINSILSSLIIIPSFLLAKEFISEKKALLTALMISLYPSNFSFSPLIMAENLYYPLFLLTIYLIYKAFTEDHYKWDVLSGISIGLTILTKINGIILIPLTAILYLYKLKKREFKFNKAFLLYTSFILVILPWILRNINLFGFSIQSIFGGYSAYLEGTTFSFPSFLMWIVIYIGIIIMSLGFIYPLLNLISFRELKDKKLVYFQLITLSSIILVMIIAANANSHSPPLYKSLINWLTWRPITRTIDVIAPLVIINGIINFKYINNIKSYITLIFILLSSILIITSQIVFFQLLPFNNMSLVLLGVISYPIKIIFNNQIFITLIFSIIFITILFILYYLYKKDKINLRNVIIITILFFSISGITNYALISYNANKYWYNDDQMQIGIWLNNYDKGKSTILIDKAHEGMILKIGQTGLYEKNRLNNTVTKIGFFMNNKIIIDSTNQISEAKYVISKDILKLEVVNKKGEIFVYKTEKG